MIAARALHHRYGTVTALHDISFEIPRGQIVGLVGPNGAGKTTAMKILTGYLSPTGGSATIAGHDVATERLAAQRALGYLPENAPLWRDMRVQDSLLFMARLREIPADRCLARLSAVVRACGLEAMLARPIGHLSKGYRQRVGLAQALIHDPQVLILDEPTSGLDPTQILEIRNMIRRMGREKTVILSTHILSEVQATCDRALVVVAGRLHADEPLTGGRREGAVVLRTLEPAPEAAGKLAALAGVRSVEPLAADQAGHAGWRVRARSGQDTAEQVGRLARACGWTVTALAPEHRDLEDIFASLEASPETGA